MWDLDFSAPVSTPSGSTGAHPHENTISANNSTHGPSLEPRSIHRPAIGRQHFDAPRGGAELVSPGAVEGTAEQRAAHARRFDLPLKNEGQETNWVMFRKPVQLSPASQSELAALS